MADIHLIATLRPAKGKEHQVCVCVFLPLLTSRRHLRDDLAGEPCSCERFSARQSTTSPASRRVVLLSFLPNAGTPKMSLSSK